MRDNHEQDRPPRAGHWVERPRPQHVAAVVIEIGLVGAAATVAVALLAGSLVATVAVGVATLGLITLVAAISSADVTTTDLRGSLLTIEQDGAVRTVDLAGSVRTRGRPEQSDWTLSATTTDGQVVELGPSQVDARAVEAAIRYYRQVRADRQPA